jgi:transcriptional regulator with XRE-family HTH domain
MTTTTKLTELDALASRIRDARLRTGLTQTELGELTGLNRDKIERIEAGKREVNALEIYPIATALKVRVLDLLAPNTTQETLHYRNLPEGSTADEIENFGRAFLRREESLDELTKPAQ